MHGRTGHGRSISLVIPAFTFHWVRGSDDVSVAMTCTVGTEATARAAAVHEFNLRAHTPA